MFFFGFRILLHELTRLFFTLHCLLRRPPKVVQGYTVDNMNISISKIFCLHVGYDSSTSMVSKFSTMTARLHIHMYTQFNECTDVRMYECGFACVHTDTCFCVYAQTHVYVRPKEIQRKWKQKPPSDFTEPPSDFTEPPNVNKLYQVANMGILHQMAWKNGFRELQQRIACLIIPGLPSIT